MVEFIFFLVITGPLGEREVPVKKFIDMDTCVQYANKNAAGDALQIPLSIGQRVTGGLCKVVKK